MHIDCSTQRAYSVPRFHPVTVDQSCHLLWRKSFVKVFFAGDTVHTKESEIAAQCIFFVYFAILNLLC
jgi:hypothetical protein